VTQTQGESMKYEIKNWSSFQQYKDDRPMRWIKLHNSLLEDYEFNSLPELSQLHLLKLWLLASKNGGKLIGDEKWFSKLINAKKLDIALLVRSGFIIRTDFHEEILKIPREDKRRVEENRGDERRITVTHTHDDSLSVFKYWQETLNHNKSAFDKTRKALINKWLKSYDVEYLKKAIHGCSVTPFNMGENDRGQVYDSLRLIFKDADQIDRFVKNSDNPPARKVKTIEQFQRESKAQTERVMRAMGMNDE